MLGHLYYLASKQVSNLIENWFAAGSSISFCVFMGFSLLPPQAPQQTYQPTEKRHFKLVPRLKQEVQFNSRMALNFHAQTTKPILRKLSIVIVRIPEKNIPIYSKNTFLSQLNARLYSCGIKSSSHSRNCEWNAIIFINLKFGTLQIKLLYFKFRFALKF